MDFLIKPEQPKSYPKTRIPLPHFSKKNRSITDMCVEDWQ